MQDHYVQTLVLPISAGAVCITGHGAAGSVIAAGLRVLANRIEALSGDELKTHGPAAVIHRHNGHYFIASGQDFITPCDIGVGEKHTVTVIGDTIEKATEALQKDNGNLGGGLVACDDWEVALYFAIQSARQSKSS